MVWVFFQTNEEHYLSPYQQPLFLPHPPPPPLQSGSSFDMDNRISPSILLIIIILAVIFFISGLLHLLVRFLFRPTNRDPEDLDNVTAFQGQLQQLFHLHDAGVDQSYIDTLPVFVYKAIIGLKNQFDCAVCLCEFEADDKLRLLPKCSHAFHLECIDTWLLSHSTCPLCRGSLLPEFPTSNGCSPVVLVLESESESSREFVSDRDASISVLGSSTVAGTGTQVGFHGEDQLGSPCNDVSMKFSEILGKGEAVPVMVSSILAEKVVPVKLGKFRNVDVAKGGGGGEGSSSNSSIDARRCFSMGSFEYVMDESSSLQVAIRPPIRKQTSKKPSLPLMPGYRAAMSECDCHSNRERFNEFDASRIIEIQGREGSIITGNAVGMNKRDSFSVSKIWLQSKKKNPSSSTEDSTRRAFSFRFPLHRTETDELKLKHSSSSSRRTISEIDVSRWENCASELGVDEEVGSCNIMDSQDNMPSFARRTLLWLVGRQNKVVHSSSSSNV